MRFSARAKFFAVTLAPAGLLLGTVSLDAGQRASWHHGKSPYRAELEVISKPNHARAGAAVSVPLCGLGRPGGLDFLAYDERGTQLPVMPLGKSANNEAIALVGARPVGSKIYVYFGSRIKAPVHKTAFLPSLTVDIRTLPEGPGENWQQVELLLGKSQRLGRVFVDNISLAYNPVDATDAVIMIFQGYLNPRQTGDLTLMLVSDDAGYLFVDDKLLVARDGRHWPGDALRGEYRQTVALAADPARIRVVIVDFGGAAMALVARWIDGKNKYPLPPDAFVQPAKTRLVTVEARYADAPAPAFWQKQLSYMSFNGAQYTEVELGTYNGRSAIWGFGDGGRNEGAKVTKLLVGLESQPVEVKQRGARAAGLVSLPEQPPRQRAMGNARDFEHYTSLMLNQNLADLRVSTLRGCISFLKYRELNADVAPFCEAILGKKHLKTETACDALLDLARAAAAGSPEKADKAYVELLKASQGQAGWDEVAREYAEFAIFRLRDLDTADKALKRIERRLSGKKRTLAALQLDLALQRGEEAEQEARAHLDRLLGGRELGKNQRYAAVQANALRQRFADLLRSGFLLDAREKLWEWADLAPEDRLSGNLSLARAKLWQAFGWPDGALAELDGAILLNPLLPNLPDVELERAVILQKAGEDRKANELLLKIVKEYPNHPAAATAKGMVK